jgi:hydrogenase maturation protein HypF
MIKRIEIRIEGIVQGVGFRPFIFRLANSCRLTGWV